MATSGSTNYSQNRNQIVIDAFALLGFVADDLQNEDVNFARRMLNELIKEWQAEGNHLWAKTEGMLFTTQYTAKYSLTGISSGAKFANLDDVVITQLSADEASGQTTISVDSSTGMTASDVVGIVLDDGTTHWSTISSVPNGTSIVIGVATTGAASENNNVYTFTNYVPIPRRIIDARLIESGIDTASSTAARSDLCMTELSHQDYFQLNSKVNNGAPIYWYYDRQLNAGNLYLWPRPSTTRYHVNVTYERFLEDFDNPTDTPDVPVEWLGTIKHNLAVRMAPAFGKMTKVREDGLDMRAELMRQQMLGWDRETTGIQFMVSRN